MSKIGHYIIELKKYECPICGELMTVIKNKLHCYSCNHSFKRGGDDDEDF